MIKSGRQRLSKALASIEGITPYKSHANFILCRWQLTDNLDDLLRHLLSNGMYVRDCRNFHGLEENFFRLAVRYPEENDRLIHHISSFTDSQPRVLS
jgi:threonine-phosphate decarboxylase